MQLPGLNTRILGKKSIYYKEIDSTQSEIWRLYKVNKIEDGTLIMADIQTQGKGTHGRIWHTDEAKNIAFSFFIKTDCELKKIEGITVEVANIIVKIIEEKYGVILNIKKPNDIVYNGRKIGGILTQSKIIKNKIKCLVIGIGLNTVQENFSKEISNIATSIKKEFDIEIEPKEFIAEFCNQFEKEIIKRKIILK